MKGSSFSWSNQRFSPGIAIQSSAVPFLTEKEYQTRIKNIKNGENKSTQSPEEIAKHEINQQTNDHPYDPKFSTRLHKFQQQLQSSTVDLELLRKLSWSGVPSSIRPQVWKILSVWFITLFEWICPSSFSYHILFHFYIGIKQQIKGYQPCNIERKEETINRKRSEYLLYLEQYFRVQKIMRSGTERDDYEVQTLRQIHIDVPRTNPTSPLFQNHVIQDSLERILFIWALRHPATGYVQGINDLVVPFFVVFLTEYYQRDVEDIEFVDISRLSKEHLNNIEADCFWCMSRLLDRIQENYTYAQAGIQKMIFKLEELIHRIDAPLAHHLATQEVEFIQFTFRWMNCLLMREFPIRLIVRIWDTYLAEAEEFSAFHVYVCAAFLVHWSPQLRSLDFQELMLFLQRLPTHKWTNDQIDLLLSQAFIYKSCYHNAPSHLRTTASASFRLPSP